MRHFVTRGFRCGYCDDLLWARHPFDRRHCLCGKTSITGCSQCSSEVEVVPGPDGSDVTYARQPREVVIDLTTGREWVEWRDQE